MQSFKMIFSGVTILQGVEFPIFSIDFAWALQQCSTTALPVMVSRHFGPRTLRTQDISAPLKCTDGSAPVPKCLADTSALAPFCVYLQQKCVSDTSALVPICPTGAEVSYGHFGTSARRPSSV